MSTLSQVNGRSYLPPVSPQPQRHPADSPRFRIEPARLPGSAEPAAENPLPPAPSPSDAPPPPAPSTSQQPADPKPRKRRRSLHSYSGGRARVSDMKSLLPRKLPCQRDLKIYEHVAFDKMPQQLVAELYGITQSRVSRIVKEVRAWRATISYEIPGMTEAQEINLATYETRMWLARIRDKCLQKVEETSLDETTTYYNHKPGEAPSTRKHRTVAPKPGFMSVALAAVMHSGKLAGAGEQWVRSRGNRGDENAKESPEHAMEFKVPSSRFLVDEVQMPATTPPPALKTAAPFNSKGNEPVSPQQDTTAPAATLNLEQETLNSPANGHSLKKKTPQISSPNGKPAGGKTSGFPPQAQAERLRRQKKRQISHKNYADAQHIPLEARPKFFRLLRELERIADRIEDCVAANVCTADAERLGRDPMAMIWEARERYLVRFLRSDESILPPPYPLDWVQDRYDPGTGRFCWQTTEESEEQVPGARCQESGARNQEPGIRSQEPGARGQGSGARNQESGGVRNQE